MRKNSEMTFIAWSIFLIKIHICIQAAISKIGLWEMRPKANYLHFNKPKEIPLFAFFKFI